MKTPGTIWIDLTDLAVWRGHMTGVQRVVFEITKRLEADPALQCRGFSYDGYAQELFIVDVPDFLRQLQSDTSQPAAPVAPSRLKTLGRSVYFKTPAGLRRRLTADQKQQLKAVVRGGVKLARTSLHNVRRLKAQLRRSSGQEHREPAVFAPQDTVLVLGKIWDSTPLVDLMAARKRAVGFRYLQLVHDLIPLFEPQLFGDGLFEPYAQYMFETIANCDTVLCNSKSTERDVLRFARELHFPEPVTAVVPLGDLPVIPEPARQPDVVLDGEPYILCVGTVEARKNHALIYQAWQLAQERGQKLPRVVIVGSRGWLVNDMIYTVEHDPDFKDVITFASGVADAELKWLYENCLFTIYPSTYEGWGLPIAESLGYGKVCIPSKASSMPEIAGNLLDYISPYSPDELLVQVVKYLDRTVRAAKEDDIKRSYTGRTWNQSYEAVKRQLQAQAACYFG